MKFGIKKETLVIKTNINGKILIAKEQWKVYRKVCFGLIKMYICIDNNNDWHWTKVKEVKVEYTSRKNATSFATNEEAEALIMHILHNPDKFIRYNYRNMYNGV